MKEKYNLEDASNEADVLREKVDSGKAVSYSEAELQHEQEKNENSLERILPGIDLHELTRDSLGVYYAPQLPETNDFDDNFLGLVAGRVIRPVSENEKRNQEKLRSLVAGRVLLDMGAGAFSNGYRVAEALGSKAYVGIEPFVGRKLHETIRHDNEVSLVSKGQPHIPFAVVKEGILSFLKRLPDNSACVLTSGIDVFVLRGFEETSGRDSDYGELEKELARVIGIDGVQISYSSDVHPQEFKKETVGLFDVYKKEL
jgi:hypothetical protein